MDMQELFAKVAEGAKAESLADKPIITLGELIAKLEQHDATATVAVEFGGSLCGFGELASYRGYYSDLAIEPYGTEPGCSVDAALTDLREAVGRTYTGYKGGDYTMHRRTLVWVDHYGSCSGIGVTGVEVRDGVVVITSADCEG